MIESRKQCQGHSLQHVSIVAPAAIKMSFLNCQSIVYSYRLPDYPRVFPMISDTCSLISWVFDPRKGTQLVRHMEIFAYPLRNFKLGLFRTAKKGSNVLGFSIQRDFASTNWPPTGKLFKIKAEIPPVGIPLWPSPCRPHDPRISSCRRVAAQGLSAVSNTLAACIFEHHILSMKTALALND